MSKIRKTFLLDKGLIEVIKALKLELHYNSQTAVVIEGINTLQRKISPSYVVGRASRSPEEKAEDQMRMQKFKKQKEHEDYMAIVEQLCGRLVKNDSGSDQVEYFTYWKSNRYKQKMPLTMMKEDLLDGQYSPSREDVEKLQAEGKVKYDPNSWE